MKKIVFAVAIGILTLGLLAQAPANPPETQKSSLHLAGQSQTQAQSSKGEKKPAAHKKHHKGTKPAANPAATTAPTK